MKTTAKHFKVFKKEVEKWIPLLGVIDWRIVIEHRDCPTGKKNCAWSSIDSSAKSCVVALSKDWSDNKIIRDTIKRSAFHEVCEVRFSDLDDMLTDRGYPQEKVDNLIHGIIYNLENVLYGIGE